MNTPRALRACLAALVLIAASLVVTTTPATAAQPEITREIRHAFSTVQHFDPVPECGIPGVTEYATGNDRFVLVDQGDSWHVTFGETYRVVVVPDADPNFPDFAPTTSPSQGTDTLHFNLTKGGTITFTEAYHQFFSRDGAQNFLRFDYYRTFVSVGDDVRVDREFSRKGSIEDVCPTAAA